MKAVVAAFNLEKALVGAFSVIVQPVVEPMKHYTALVMNLFVLQIISITRPQIGDFLMGVGGQWSSNTLYRDFTALQCLMKIHLLVMARGSRWLDVG